MGALSQSVEEFVASLPVEEQELARHVLLGDINEKTGRPVGFHHAPNGVTPPGRRIDKVLERYPDGTYRAIVSIYDPRYGWVEKGRYEQHTMFPDHWSRHEVMAAGREAYLGRVDRSVKRWRGHARGVAIRGYRREDGRGPATFFPDRDL